MGFTSYWLGLFLYIMSSYLMRYSVLHELNTLESRCRQDSVDVWNNSSRCRQESVITLRFCINCSAIICSPTVIFSILREASSETYGPGSILYHINLLLFLSPFILLSLLLVFIIKIPKILSYHLYQISLLQVVVKGLTTPLSRWLQGSYLFV